MQQRAVIQALSDKVAARQKELFQRSWEVEPVPPWRRLTGMADVIHEILRPIVRSFIEDRTFSLFQKAANWLDAKIPSRTARVALGFLLGLTAIASVVIV